MTDLKVQYDRLKFLPPVTKTLCYNHDGLIVGSTAELLLGLRNDIQRDLDILVPFYEWGTLVGLFLLVLQLTRLVDSNL